ncbi:MAG TPA: PDZ domain-containing protein, partial [Candidatus Omnitrophica bacterium]|nr:PDZ domain-containing protein [Candidatus Omnitrophota bacterium]
MDLKRSFGLTASLLFKKITQGAAQIMEEKVDNKKRFRFIISVCAVIFLSCAFIYLSFAKEPEEPAEPKPIVKEDIYRELELFADSITLINASYVDEIPPKDLIYGALKGMLASLDLHSEFLKPEEYDEIKIDTGGEFGGLGIEITIREGLITIITPLEGTPAERAGLQPGDKIVKIDGESTENFTLNDAVSRMRGKAGTEVAITILREGERKLLDFTIKRAIIKVKSIKEALIIEDSIGYIRLVEFQTKTGEELDRVLKELKNQGLSGLILDLRNNPGGVLESAVSVSEKFLPKDSIIVSIKGRAKEKDMVFKSKNEK